MVSTAGIIISFLQLCLGVFLGDRCSIASRCTLPEFYQEPGGLFRIEQHPPGARTDTSARLQWQNAVRGQRTDDRFHIVHFEQDVVDASALLLEELPARVAIALKRLDELEFEVAYLDERLPDANALFLPPIPVLRVGPVGPLDEVEGPYAEQRRQQRGR